MLTLNVKKDFGCPMPLEVYKWMIRGANNQTNAKNEKPIEVFMSQMDQSGTLLLTFN
jgi:hypothetical protein